MVFHDHVTNLQQVYLDSLALYCSYFNHMLTNTHHVTSFGEVTPLCCGES